MDDGFLKVDLAPLAEPVGRALFGEPNRRLSKPREELRWGENGSLKIDLKAATFFDFEANEGGGLLDLIRREQRLSDDRACFDWMRGVGISVPEPREGRSQRRKGDGRIPAKTIKEVYDYRDEAGALLYQVVRFEPKEFRQRRPMAEGGWAWGVAAGRYGRVKGEEVWRRLKDREGAGEVREMPDARMVPYRLPEVLEAVKAGRTIYVVEGEKDVATLEGWGIAASTGAGGAGKWRPDYASAFAGADVVLLPDNDQTGRAHMDDVARQLAPAAARVRLLDLAKHQADFPEKADVSDWAKLGGTADLLGALAETEAEEWTPRAPEAPWEKFMLRDMLDYRPKGEWLVEDWLGSGQLAVLYGAPKTGKSFVALDMSLRIAHGWSWFGKKTRKSAVFYIAGEGGEGVKKRVALWAQERPRRDPAAPFVMVPQRFDFHEPGEGVGQIAGWIKAAGPWMGAPFGLIVVDTLARAMGAGDENAASDMGRIIETCDRLRAETGCTVLLVHHAGKDAARGMRGHSSLFGAADAVLEIRPEVDEEGKEVPEVKTLILRDQKDGEAGGRFPLRLRRAALGHSRDGDGLDHDSAAPAATSCVVEWVRDAGSPSEGADGMADPASGQDERTEESYRRRAEDSALRALDKALSGSEVRSTPRGPAVTPEVWAKAFELLEPTRTGMAPALDRLRAIFKGLRDSGRIVFLEVEGAALVTRDAPF
ncbi:AAA family ATPase [Neomegalonema sp.]|uniref:AAA family ATPase n=1 Tax=Neomegalonema sp. TaxID=2039713 RepID=UPI0026371F49|nr:AAA family ATPase [Neomegalonema sp.]MDD2870340.1 AAA family ATPase [Neomegalonema sp.]